MVRGDFEEGVRLSPTRGEAITDLFEANYEPMCRLAFVIVGDVWLAEEIVMEALVKTYSGWGRLREPDRVDVYLRRAVINLSRSHIRRAVLERRARASQQAAPERNDFDLEAKDEVWSAVRNLPERQRASVVLRYFEDLSEEQIAEVMDCSTGTVKSQLHKARSSLARVLGEQGVDDARPR